MLIKENQIKFLICVFFDTHTHTVPEPPANIKAAALTADSVLVSWLSPKHKNGQIQHYTVYSREAGRKGQVKS